MSYANRVDANQAAVVAALERVGALCVLTNALRDDGLDVLVGFRGRWTWLEIKDGRKPPSHRALQPSQARIIARANALHLPVAVVGSEAEALAAIGAIEPQPPR